MDFDKYCLSYFNIAKISPPDGTVNHISLGAPYNYFGIIINGTARFTAGDNDFVIGKGEVVYIPKGQVYRSEWHGSPHPVFYSLPHIFMTERENDTRFSLQRVDISGAREMGDKIYERSEQDPMGAMSLFYTFYSMAVPKLTKEKRQGATYSVMPAVRYIEKNHAEKFDVRFLASLCGMSESGFYDVFKKQTFCSPVEYKNKIRCIRAAELLKNTDYTVEYISEKLGFSSPMYMRRVLYKFTGKTPRNIRKGDDGII